MISVAPNKFSQIRSKHILSDTRARHATLRLGPMTLDFLSVDAVPGYEFTGVIYSIMFEIALAQSVVRLPTVCMNYAAFCDPLFDNRLQRSPVTLFDGDQKTASTVMLDASQNPLTLHATPSVVFPLAKLGLINLKAENKV